MLNRSSAWNNTDKQIAHSEYYLNDVNFVSWKLQDYLQSESSFPANFFSKIFYKGLYFVGKDVILFTFDAMPQKKNSTTKSNATHWPLADSFKFKCGKIYCCTDDDITTMTFRILTFYPVCFYCCASLCCRDAIKFQLTGFLRQMRCLSANKFSQYHTQLIVFPLA